MQGAHPHAIRPKREGRINAVEVKRQRTIAAKYEGLVSKMTLVTFEANRRCSEVL